MGKPTTVTLSDLENFLSSRRSAPPTKSKPVPKSMKEGNPEAMDNVRAVLGGFTGLRDAPSVMSPGANELYDRSELAGMLSNLVPGKAALSGLGAGVIKRLYHGGTYVPGEAIRRVLYAAPDRKMAETYIDMAQTRFGGSPSLRPFDVDLDPKKMAPEHWVEHYATNAGIPYHDYTPASAFDANLHGEESVDKLIGGLRSAGFDHAVLEDVPFGYGSTVRGIPLDGTSYVLFPETAATMKPVSEQPILQGVYRGRAGDPSSSGKVFASPQKAVGERYAAKRAAQTGEDPHLDMLLVDPNAGRKYGHAVIGTGKDKPLTTMARELSEDDIKDKFQLYAKGGSVTDELPRGIARAAGALRRAEEERQMRNSVFNQPREERWQPEYVREPALEPPMISPDDLIGTGIPTKIAMAVKGATPMLAGLGVIKNKGGNWLTGSVEDALSGLKKPIPQLNELNIGRPRGAPKMSEQEYTDYISQNFPTLPPLNNWIDKQLTRYVKNEMATPEDPVRALAERGVLHFDPRGIRDRAPIMDKVLKRREIGGFPLQDEGGSLLSEQWERYADAAIRPMDISEMTAGQRGANQWVEKVPANTQIHQIDYQQLGGPMAGEGLGFSHLTDELANALNPESGLPRHLLLDPKSMERVSVPQAVERVSQINAWRAAQKAEADALRANNAATVLHKDYPDKGFKWVELKAQQEADRAALQDALKYEGDTMGHCVGGYCDDVASGRSRIYSLRDAKGQPHVTIEVRPDLNYDKVGGFDNMDLQRAMFENVPKNRHKKLQNWLEEEWQGGDLAAELASSPFAQYLPPPAKTQSIVQIKGKANRAPNEEYLPFVQDFVRSGKWSDVGDLQNTGMLRLTQPVVQRADGRVVEIPAGYHTLEDIRGFFASPDVHPELSEAQAQALITRLGGRNFAHGGSVQQINPFTVQSLQAIIASLRQEHSNG